MKQTLLLFYLYFLSHSCIYAFDQAAIPARPFFNNAWYPTARLKLLLTLDYERNRTEMLSLLGQKADPNVTEGDVSALILHKAVRKNDFVVVEKALACGADPNVIDETGSSLLMHVECPRIAHCLLDSKANPAFVNEDGENCLHTAVHKPFKVMAIFCNAHVDPSQRDTIQGNTPVHRLFSNWGRGRRVPNFGTKIAALLLAGGDFTIQNRSGNTPLTKAPSRLAAQIIAAYPHVKKEREEYTSRMNHCLNEHFPEPIAQLTMAYAEPPVWDKTYWNLFKKYMRDLPEQ